MVNICLYFQVHQPFRMAKYNIFDIKNHSNYFDEQKNKEIFNKVAKKCYIPASQILLKLLKDNPSFKVSFSLSGTFVEQAEKYNPYVLDLFKRLNATGQVEFLGETYYHSLSSLFSKDEFVHQVKMHSVMIKSLFGAEPKVFRNTELIYNDKIAKIVSDLGFSAILAEGTDKILDGKSPNYLYHSKVNSKLKLLLKNYKLSDDIAFRFSDTSWSEYPLTASKYSSWIGADSNSEIINLFMDYETFGEHQWGSTGIFKFLNELPSLLLKDHSFVTPSEASQTLKSKGSLSIKEPISWADKERDVSAWIGNDIQDHSLSMLYSLRSEVLKAGDNNLIDLYRKLLTSDHFYYMCTKHFSDGDVHKYFNPYSTPYDAFINMANIHEDLKWRLQKINMIDLQAKSKGLKTDKTIVN